MSVLRSIFAMHARIYYGWQKLYALLVPQKAELATRRTVGLRGEEAAVRFLRLRGWRILERNWRMGRYELDIIARDGEDLVFVEVKTRKSTAIEDPCAAMDKSKRRAFLRAVQLWRAKHESLKEDAEGCRCDLIAVTYTIDAAQHVIFQVEHYVNVVSE